MGDAGLVAMVTSQPRAHRTVVARPLLLMLLSLTCLSMPPYGDIPTPADITERQQTVTNE
ncbi:hypothetical protein CQZ88_08135 [Rhodococcus sp. ENV425]|nr:hypothetical protein CQZ88_08135 [Rhodococcus sp. ENV425]